jgi:hypothetical protein
MRFATVLACLALFGSVSSTQAECLKPNVDGQTAQGKLTVGRAQDAAGRPERPYILQLAAAICLDADDSFAAVASTRTIHVFPGNAKLQPAFRRLTDKIVVVRGNPFAAHTAHHHAPIVMQVSEIRQR